MLIGFAHRELSQAPRLRDWGEDNVHSETAILLLRLPAALDWIGAVVESLRVIALDSNSSGDGAEQVFTALQAV